MNSHICLYNSKMLISSLDNCEAYLNIYKSVNFTDHCFKEVIKLKLPLQSSIKPKEVLLNTVDFYALSLNCVLVVVLGESGDLDIFLYSDILEGNLFKLKYIEQSSNLTTLDCSLFLTHGPTCFTHIDEKLMLHSLDLKFSNILNLHSKFPAKGTKVLFFMGVGQIFNQNVYLIVVSGKISSKESICFFAIGVPNKHHKSKVLIEKLAMDIFFPEFLINCALSVDVSNLQTSDENITDLNCIKWNDNHSVVCSKSQCFVCVKGKIMYAVNLPFQNVSFIQSELYPSLLDESYLILLFETNQVMFFKPMKDSNELLVKKSWTNIQSFLIGDILMNASKQLLLFKNSDIENWQSDYILTDISGLMPIDILDQPSLPNECLKSTLSGLNAKYQIGKLSVAQKEFEIEEKKKATLDALNKLNETAHECFEDACTFQDSLVNIILCNDENKKIEMSGRKNKQKLKTLDHWVKFLNGCWYICWTFQNVGDSTLCFPVLKSILENQRIQSIQKIFVHSSSPFSLEDKTVKQIKPSETFSVVSKLEDITCFDEKIEVSVVLSWFIGSSAEFENELFLTLEDKCLEQGQLSFKTYLDANDIFSKISQGLTTIEELFCMKLCQQKVVFKISSLFSNLHDMEKRLLESNAQQFILFNNSSQKVFAFKSEGSHLLGTSFRLEKLDKNDAEMEIFVRNSRDLQLVLKFFQRCLPKDVMFFPYGKTSNELIQLKQDFVCAMKDETDLLVGALNAHNISAQIKDYSEAEIQAGAIVIPRKTFLRIRRALVKKESITDLILKNIHCTEI